MTRRGSRGQGATAAAIVFAAAVGQAAAQEPGATVAAPRFALSTAGNTTVFVPANLVVEQGDWVRWTYTGTLLFHTVTSRTGTGCFGDGRFTSDLGPAPAPSSFTRRFVDPVGAISYFCQPHCLSMFGTVTVTTPIALTASETSGTLTLNWTGGSGRYRVFRDTDPRLRAATATVLAPAGGETGTSMTDTLRPAVGTTLYYYAGNRF